MLRERTAGTDLLAGISSAAGREQGSQIVQLTRMDGRREPYRERI
jgi:hypothetical protein